MYNIHQFRGKASVKPAQEPAEETPSELRERLTQELQVMNREDAEEKEEEQQQKFHELSKPHWSQARKKPGPKNKEEDEALMERFPDGQVSCASNHDQHIIFILLFSVSAVSKNHQANNSWKLPLSPQTGTYQREEQVSMARVQLCKDVFCLHFYSLFSTGD